MGTTRWDDNDWKSYSSTTQTKTQSQIFTQQTGHNDLDPKTFKFRESVASAANPDPTPIIVAVDETGSMGYLAEAIIKTGLGVIMKEIYDRQPVSDPHLMCMAVGDGFVDRHPLQMTQFESAVPNLTKQVEQFYIEGNGGGNGGESYNLAWYGAAYRTKCDAFKKGKKGYLFTIGDEPPHMDLPKGVIKMVTGDGAEADMTSQGLLDILTPNWEVFHLAVGYGADHVSDRWKKMLKERLITVSDHTKLAEIIVSTMQITEGTHVNDVVDSWSGDTSVVVANAVKALRARPGAGTGTAPVAL